MVEISIHFKSLYWVLDKVKHEINKGHEKHDKQFNSSNDVRDLKRF